MSTYSIGAATFVSMSRPPRRSAQQAVNEVRPGMDGHAIFLTGVRGDEFEVRTFRDVVTPATVEGVAHAYHQLKNTLQVLTYNGVTEANLYQVLDVQIIDASRTVIGIGGLASLSSGKVEAAWRLIETQVPVPAPPPPPPPE